MDQVTNLPGLIGLILTWALIDSFDPCIYALFTSLIATTLGNVKSAIKAGSAFLLSLYIGYYILGLLLRVISLRLPPMILVLVMFTYGLIMLTTAMLRNRERTSEMVCREDDIPCRVASKLRLYKLIDLINRDNSAISIPLVIVLGLIASFTLAPCSAFLFLAYNIIMKEYGTLTWALMTALYVFVFISPMILMLLALVGFSKLTGIERTILGNEIKIKLVGALIIIATAIYLLLVYV